MKNKSETGRRTTLTRITGFIIVALFFMATGIHAEEFCFDEAGVKYGINPIILRAIAKVESNFNPRAINRNRNGTYDFGVMQINSSWANNLGMEHWMTLGDPCSNIKTGAKILGACMKKYGYSWEAIGCYNSQTPDKRDRYALLVFRQLKHIEKEDQELKKKQEAADRDRGSDLLAAGENNQAGEIAPTNSNPVPVPAEAQQSQLPSSVEQPADVPDLHPVEMSASTIFAGSNREL